MILAARKTYYKRKVLICCLYSKCIRNQIWTIKISSTRASSFEYYLIIWFYLNYILKSESFTPNFFGVSIQEAFTYTSNPYPTPDLTQWSTFHPSNTIIFSISLLISIERYITSFFLPYGAIKAFFSNTTIK